MLEAAVIGHSSPATPTTLSNKTLEQPLPHIDPIATQDSLPTLLSHQTTPSTSFGRASSSTSTMTSKPEELSVAQMLMLDSKLSSHSELVAKLTTLDCPSLLRGTSYMNVLRKFGKIMRTKEGSAKTYDMSHPVVQIDAFISHNWSVPALTKFFALTLHFNTLFATAFTLCVAVMISLATAWGLLPIVDFGGAPEGHRTGFVSTVICPLVFMIMLCCKHEFFRYLRIPGESVFLDKVCIHQTDLELKKRGIQSLSAYIVRSSSIVIVYTNEYLRRLWTVYELATFLILFPNKPVVLLPTDLSALILMATFALSVQCLLSFVTFSEQVGIVARLASHCFPAVVAACYLRSQARHLDEMQRVVDTFTVAKTCCACEDDRPLVESNIVSFLKHCNMVSLESIDEHVLERFDEHVQSTFGGAIRKALGPVGTRYRWVLVFSLMGSGTSSMDYIGALLHDLGATTEVVLTIIELLSWHLVGLPLAWALLAHLTSHSVKSRGVCEVLVVLLAAVLALLTFAVMYFEISLTILHPIAKASWTGLSLFVAYHVCLGLFTLGVVYNESKCR
eukprot:TRINITY_DN40524_c0_g1_i1.p1 TRINITY_DN40524_c0_g1~~TRINITY_DN40524_c0_g1_i1.p1  ORF type:complete len:562 (+),score=55.16 TRINITY_DN40524_c0_g1_i1:181-1866(+)